MKINTLRLILLAMVLGLTSCFEEGDFPDTPRIEFENVTFKVVGGTADPDSLTFTILFEDGNGDLGLDDSFTDFDFRKGDFFVNSEGSLVNIENSREPDSNLPQYELPFSCDNWIETPTFNNFCSLAGINSADCARQIEALGLPVSTTGTNNMILDTLYYVPNPNRFNYFLGFEEQINADPPEYVDFDFIEVLSSFGINPCGVILDATFPPLLDDPNDRSSTEGSIRFSFVSLGSQFVFDDRRIRVSIRIQDRALNSSNTVFTPPFTLDEIRVN